MTTENGIENVCDCELDEDFDESAYVKNVFALMDAFQRSEHVDVISRFGYETETEGNIVEPALDGLKKIKPMFKSNNAAINAVSVALNDPAVLAAVLCYFERHPDVAKALQIWGALQEGRPFDD